MYEAINGNAPKFNRTSSKICASPEEELLEAVLNNNTQKIEQLILRNEYLLDHKYEEYEKTILLIACSEGGIEAGTVDKLLNLNANPRNPCNQDADGWEALHFASKKTDYAIMDVLLTGNRVDVNAVNRNGNNALQILIRYGNRNSPVFLKCAELLLRNGIDINHADNRNHTALFWADKRDVGDDIRRIIKDQTTPVNEALSNNIQEEANYGKQLLSLLKQENETEFITFRHGDIHDLANYHDDGATLLQICCRKGLTKAAKHLLQNGADPNLTGSKDSVKPAIIAAENGYRDILEALLEKYNSISTIPEGLLAVILRYIDAEYHDNIGCYEVFMNKMKGADPDEVSLKLNEADSSSNSPLHYAIRFADVGITEELLSLGASLGAKNQYGIMPVKDIEPDILEKHLNNCVSFDLKDKKFKKEDFIVTFNYRSLIPPYATSVSNEASSYKDVDEEDINSKIQKKLVAETEVKIVSAKVICLMSKTSEFKHLLNHPVIVSFLFMKWLRIQRLFWVNLAFYITFALSLVVYIFSQYAYFSTAEKSEILTFFVNFSYICLVVTLITLIFRELFQICVAPTEYFKNFENYIEMILIIITCMIVFSSSPSQQLSSLSILLAAFELVLMIGHHPFFSTNVVMLRTVSFNFFKFLIWYSLLIIAFALSFYLLFTTDLQNNKNNSRMEVNNATSENSDDDKSFENPGKSVFKTIIMLTGEFDASSMNFDTFPVTSKLIFALFIFMIAIILVNLLNGLAVSDTQIIKNDAELVGHIARAQSISYIESMLVGNIMPIKFMEKLNNTCCCLPILHDFNFQICKAFARDACLFPNYLNYELKFYPNKYGLIDINSDEGKSRQKSCTSCAAIYLDRDTIRRTNNIVQARREESARTKDRETKQFEDEILSLHQKIDNLSKLLNAK